MELHKSWNSNTFPYEERKKIAKKVLRKYIPKKITVFEFQEFPYIIGGKNIPPRTKRGWKNASKVVKKYAKDNKLKPILVKQVL